MSVGGRGGFPGQREPQRPMPGTPEMCKEITGNSCGLNRGRALFRCQVNTGGGGEQAAENRKWKLENGAKLRVELGWARRGEDEKLAGAEATGIAELRIGLGDAGPGGAAA